MKRYFVIGYDITHPRRLTKAYRTVTAYAVPIEYSIFMLHGTLHEAERCMQALTRIIDPRQDDLRCYPLPARGLWIRLGKANLPGGVICTGLPSGAIMVV